MAEYVTLLPGDPAPWFSQRATTNPRYVFDTAAGRFIVLCFFGSASDPQAQSALADIRQNRHVFDDQRAAFFGVTVDPADEHAAAITEQLPGLRFLLDFDGTVSRLYGSLATDAAMGQGRLAVRRFWLVLDPGLRVAAVIPFAADGSDRAKLLTLVASLPPPDRFAGFEVFAPILVLPHVFEPALCEALIAGCQNQASMDSIFMREEGGRTVGKVDYSHKRRRDYAIADETLRARIQNRIRRRVIPEIHKAFQFDATRMERYIVACYDADEGGHFRAHRDNTTKGTAHRRFALSLNLNADFDGGEVVFPEFGPRSYKPSLGGAIVFSCSLLHAVTRVTRGRRYAFLPFFYDEPAAQQREANNGFLDESVAPYQQSPAVTE